MNKNFGMIERAVRYVGERGKSMPGEGELAAHLNISSSALKELFTGFAGIGAGEFIQFLSSKYARRLLEEKTSFSPGRHEDPSNCGKTGDQATPLVGALVLKPGAALRGIEVIYGFHESPFGECVLSLSKKRVCGLQFISSKGRESTLGEIKKFWKGGRVEENWKVTGQFMERIFPPPGKRDRVPLFLKGTQFQIKVWMALLRIPFGGATSYSALAREIGMEGADRAVGNAVGANPLAYIIPCHRVIRKNGSFGNYRSGSARKIAMIGWEAAKRKEWNDNEIFG